MSDSADKKSSGPAKTQRRNDVYQPSKKKGYGGAPGIPPAGPPPRQGGSLPTIPTTVEPPAGNSWQSNSGAGNK